MISRENSVEQRCRQGSQPPNNNDRKNPLPPPHSLKRPLSPDLSDRPEEKRLCERHTQPTGSESFLQKHKSLFIDELHPEPLLHHLLSYLGHTGEWEKWEKKMSYYDLMENMTNIAHTRSRKNQILLETALEDSRIEEALFAAIRQNTKGKCHEKILEAIKKEGIPEPQCPPYGLTPKNMHHWLAISAEDFVKTFLEQSPQSQQSFIDSMLEKRLLNEDQHEMYSREHLQNRSHQRSMQLILALGRQGRTMPNRLLEVLMDQITSTQEHEKRCYMHLLKRLCDTAGDLENLPKPITGFNEVKEKAYKLLSQ